MEFKIDSIYELIEAEKFSASCLKNKTIAEEIISSGGIIVPKEVTDKGSVLAAVLGNEKYNPALLIWSTEAKYFKEIFPENTFASKPIFKDRRYNNENSISI